LTDPFQHVKYISDKLSRISANKIICQISFQNQAQAAYGRHLCVVFSKSVQITKNFPCSNATTLQGGFKLWLTIVTQKPKRMNDRFKGHAQTEEKKSRYMK
jgi:hypothetical protein